METTFLSLHHSVGTGLTIRGLASLLDGRMGQTPTLLFGDAGQGRFKKVFPEPAHSKNKRKPAGKVERGERNVGLINIVELAQCPPP